MIRMSDGEASARQCHVSLKQSRHLSTKVTPKEYHDFGLLSNLWEPCGGHCVTIVVPPWLFFNTSNLPEEDTLSKTFIIWL